MNMASRHAHRLLTVAFLAATFALGGPAFAQEEGPSEETAARVLRMVKNANDEFDRGEYGDALEIYQEAYDLYPDPVLLYRIGLAAEKNGEPRRAFESYRAFVEASDADDPTAKRVADKLPDLRAKLAPMVTVQSTPSGADVFVGEIGEEPVARTPAELELAEGEQTVVIRLEGFRVARRELSLENGQYETVEVELEELRQLADEPEKPVQADSEGPGLATWGWIATGTGVALLGTGAVFSGLTASKTSDVNDYDKRAPGASRDELEDLKSQAESFYDTSIATYVAGGVLTSVGAVLLAIDYLSSSESDAPADEAALQIQLSPTPSGGWVGLSGRF
jgi:tetratricopeptide (TPR) repeat protein